MKHKHGERMELPDEVLLPLHQSFTDIISLTDVVLLSMQGIRYYSVAKRSDGWHVTADFEVYGERQKVNLTELLQWLNGQ